MSESIEERLDRLEAEVRLARDKQEINDQLCRYARGVDRCDQALIESTFPAYPAGGVVAYAYKNTLTMMHFLGNCLIEVDGDEAQSETYFVSYHRIDRDGVEFLRMRGARYLHLWERTESGGWVSTDRTMLDEWNTIDEVTEKDDQSRWTLGQRGPDDPAFHIRDYLIAGREKQRATFARIAEVANG